MEHTLEGFEFKDLAATSSKLSRFFLDGSTKLHVVSDFDLTLTMGKTAGENAGSWL